MEQTTLPLHFFLCTYLDPELFQTNFIIYNLFLTIFSPEKSSFTQFNSLNFQGSSFYYSSYVLVLSPQRHQLYKQWRFLLFGKGRPLITFSSSSLNPASSRVTAGYYPAATFLWRLEHRSLGESQILTRERDKISLFILTASWFAMSPSYP